MATQIVPGQTNWSMVRDEEGHREYKLTHLIVGHERDGPTTVLNTPGLPLPGTPWVIDNDVDLWAWCRANMTITPVVTKEPNLWWTVEQTFSTKPPDRDKQRCQDIPIENPLLEPQKISGSFVKFQEEATHDRFGNRINTSSHEQIRGPQVEFDNNRPNLVIEQNVPALELEIVSLMMDTVNSVPIWGMGARRVKLSGFTWDRKFHGQCSIYYTRKFEFDINRNTFDRDLLDEGTKALSGHWGSGTECTSESSGSGGAWILDPIKCYSGFPNPDPRNPAHFKRFKDRNDENCRVILDGHGKPWDPEQVATITACPGCDRSPQDWNLYGFEGGTIRLPHASGCKWEANAGAGTIVLEQVGSKWVLVHSLFGPGIWEVDSATWNCMGPNVMNRTEGNGPSVIGVTADADDAPGNVHVEKYPQSNFLLLGVPLIF